MNLVFQLRYAALSLLAVTAFWLTPASGTGVYPVLHANDTICYEGVWVKFKCEGGSVWMMNASQLYHMSTDGDYFIKSAHHRNILNIKCLDKFNSSILSCFNGVTQRKSNNVSFLVQGLLGPVSDLVYLPQNKTLSWEPPFQLNTSQAITYNILVTEVAEDQLIVNHSNQSETYLNLTGKIERGFTYSVSLWPLNVVGKGQETSMVFSEEPAATSSSVVTGSDGTTSAPTDDPNKHDPTQLTSRMRAALPWAVAGFVLLVVVMVLVIGIIAVIWKERRPSRGTMETRTSPAHNVTYALNVSSSSQQHMIGVMENNSSPQQHADVRGTSPMEGKKDGVRKRKKI